MKDILTAFSDSIELGLKDIESLESETLKMIQLGRLDSSNRLLDLHDKSSSLLLKKMGFYCKLLELPKPKGKKEINS